MPLKVKKHGDTWRLEDDEGHVTPAHFDSKERAEAARSAISIAKAREAGHRIPRLKGKR